MKLQRNDKCWCGSDKKYKNCHLEFDEILEDKKRKGFKIPTHKMIKTDEQIEGIKKASVINNGLLDLIEKNIKAGMSTQDIDDMTNVYLNENNARSADLNYEGYPKSICTSVNDVVCHGIPSPKVILKQGDIINVDATTYVGDYCADASRMFMIGEVSDEAKRLVTVTKECLDLAVEAIVPFETTIGDLGAIIEKHAKQNGYSVVREFCGHGVGIEMHEDPYVLHYKTSGKTTLIVPGMVFTIEPMINQGKRNIHLGVNDEWTVFTDDHKLSAQWEYTIAITKDGVEVLSK